MVRVVFFSLLVFLTTPFEPSPKYAFSRSFVTEVGIFSPFSYFNYLSSILLFRRHCHVALFNPSSLSGVLCPLLKSFSSYQVLHLFSTGVMSEFVLPCSSFLMECFQLCSSPLYSFLKLVNLARFSGFTRLSKKQLSCTSRLPLPFPLRCHSRSRDEILS